MEYPSNIENSINTKASDVDNNMEEEERMG